jgi:acyl carrier protein
MVINDELKQFVIDKIVKKSTLQGVYIEKIDDSFSLTGSGLFDSMDFLNLINEVEASFKLVVDFSDAAPEEFTTLGGFILNCK